MIRPNQMLCLYARYVVEITHFTTIVAKRSDEAVNAVGVLLVCNNSHKNKTNEIDDTFEIDES